jgi:hypothetical protein
MPTTVIDPRRLLICLFALLAVAIAAFAGPGRAEANTKCANAFRVLHNDHVGRLSLRAGSYRITVINQNELSCQQASDLFRSSCRTSTASFQTGGR